MRPSQRRSSTPAPTSCRRPRSSSRRISSPIRQGLGFKAGWTWRDLTQHYDFFQTELTPTTGLPPITLASIPNGVINKNVSLYDGQGQTLLLLNRYAIDQYVAANMTTKYTVQTAADIKADNCQRLSAFGKDQRRIRRSAIQGGRSLCACSVCATSPPIRRSINYLPVSLVPTRGRHVLRCRSRPRPRMPGFCLRSTCPMT